ncbi:DUF4142 domain-containing protein [Flavobacterium sp. RHBU_24]|uniref:DUF4142 domain-containing protein n=1 Tax=Flavobacterium sp. RHBU_24 TaxID=3391185 RepID=UPI003984FDF0
MKKTTLFGKLFLGAAVVTMSLGAVSCKEKQKDSEEVAEETNDETFENAENDSLEDDSDYLVFAAETDLKEIELGKLAQQKGLHAETKAFGKMMEEMHTKALNELKTTAAAKNITIPQTITEDGQEAWDNLNKKEGHDFDEAYADDMVDGHEKAINKIEKAADKAQDPDIKTWAANMLPNLKSHLEQAKTLEATVDAAD